MNNSKGLTPMDIVEIKGAALLILKNMGYIPDAETITGQDFLRLWIKWGGDTNTMSRFDRQESAIVAFKRWVKEMDEKGKQAQARMTTRQLSVDRIGVTFQIPLGKGMLHFHAEGSIPPDCDKDELEAHYQALFQVTVNGYNEMRNNPPQLAKSVNSPYEPKEGERTETLEFDRIRVITDNNKRMYRVIGGNYKKHGVYIYPEVLGKAGIDPLTLAFGDNFLSGTATLLMKGDGSPDKVVSIAKNPLL